MNICRRLSARAPPPFSRTERQESEGYAHSGAAAV